MKQLPCDLLSSSSPLHSPKPGLTICTVGCRSRNLVPGPVPHGRAILYPARQVIHRPHHFSDIKKSLQKAIISA